MNFKNPVTFLNLKETSHNTDYLLHSQPEILLKKQKSNLELRNLKIS